MNTVPATAAGELPPPAPWTPPLHVESSGRGSPLVFWHGWGMNLRVFDALRGALGEDFRTHAVDLPGHGRSAWPAIGASGADAFLQPLLRTLPERSTLVAWSLGAQLALQAAALVPERVARLVLIGVTPRFVRAADWPHGIDESVLAQMRTRLSRDYRGTLSDFLELQLRGSRDGSSLLLSLRATLLAHGEAQPAALSAGLAALAHADLRALLPGIQQPTLVIAGRNDRVTPPAAAAALAAALPNARYHEYLRAAHAPFLSHTAEFLSLLHGFLAEAREP